MARAALGGEYTVLFNGVEVRAFAKATPCADRRARPIFFIGRHEPRKGLAVLLEAMADLPPDVRLWIAGDGPETERAAARVAGDARIEWLGRISDEEKAAPPAGRRRVLRAVAAGRVVRRGAARGHGGRDAGRGQRPARLRQRGPRRPRRPAGAAGRRPGAGRRPAAGARPTRAAPPSWWRRASSGPASSPWSAWPSATSSSTSRIGCGPAPLTVRAGSRGPVL